jgi:hypothetical protein
MVEPREVYHALDFAIAVVHEGEAGYLRFADFHLEYFEAIEYRLKELNGHQETAAAPRS